MTRRTARVLAWSIAALLTVAMVAAVRGLIAVEGRIEAAMPPEIQVVLAVTRWAVLAGLWLSVIWEWLHRPFNRTDTTEETT